MSSGGSCAELAAKVAAALLDQGCTNLEAKVASYIASFGDTNWQTDGKLSKTIAKDRWGARYHPGSIARARRLLTRAGFIHSKRIKPGEVPPGADYPSAHGTTSKGMRWKAIGVARPPKSERRKMAAQAKAAERHERLTKPRYVAPGAIAPQDYPGRAPISPKPDPELAKVLDTWTASMESVRARRAALKQPSAARPGAEPDPPE